MEEELKIPFSDGECEFTERKSRFIGQVRKVETADEAVAKLQKIKKKHYNARHNVYAYILRGGVMRFSDDGEPQGTGGMPVLEVLRRENMVDTLIVVTRYFGGILLGAGGLTRAYAGAAKKALDFCGTAVLRRRRTFSVTCSYHDFPILQNAILQVGCEAVEISYLADVTFSVSVPEEQAEKVTEMIRDMTAGGADILDKGECLVPEKV